MKLNQNIIRAGVALAALTTTQVWAQTLSDQKTVVRNAVLTRQEGQMAHSMDVCLDDLSLNHIQSVAIRPVLISKDGLQRVAFDPLVVDSRAQHVLYRRGQTNQTYRDVRHVKRSGSRQTEFYHSTIPYQPWMRSYELVLEEDLCGCGDLTNLPSVPSLSRNQEPQRVPLLRVQLMPDDYKKVRQLEGRAYVDFRLDKINLDPTYRRNPEELKKILATIDEVRGKKDVDIDRVTIHGYASPEGTYQHNTWLAENRAATLSNYIQKLYKFKAGVIGSTSTPEDWAGLREYVDKSQMEERAAILSIIDSQMDPDAKDAQIKKQFPERYRQLLADVYPGLRHSDYTIVYNIRPYTLEESREIYRTKPQDLSLAELVALAQDAGMDTPEGRAIIYRTAELLPDNPRAILLAAQTAVGQGDYARAEQILPANIRDPQQAYVLGGIRKMQLRLSEARALMEQALNGGVSEAQAQLEEIAELSGE